MGEVLKEILVATGEGGPLDPNLLDNLPTVSWDTMSVECPHCGNRFPVEFSCFTSFDIIEVRPETSVDPPR